MNLRAFLKAGHTPTLLCAFLYFDISFMVWVMLGALANSISDEFNLTISQRGFMVAVPLLGGSILRLVLGMLTDHIGARRTAILGMILTLAPLLMGWLWADSFAKVILLGLLLGVAGASFAVALPLASRWYPPQYQGLAMGIAGAGNSGTALATFFAPRIAEAAGWHAVFGLAIIPIALTFLTFLVFAKDSPAQPAPKSLKDYGQVLGQADTWWFCLFYSVTFGGFVGLASFLNSFFKLQHELTPVAAGNFATACVIAGSCLRPIGGHLADRFGGVRMLTVLFVGAAGLIGGMALLPSLAVASVLLFLCMGLLGMGNGSVFQLVPLRFPKEIGVITGVVGAAGGVGGFCLPTLLGASKEWTGSYAGGFALFAVVGLASAAALVRVSRRWQGEFIAKGGVAVASSPPLATTTAPANEPAPEREPSHATA